MNTEFEGTRQLEEGEEADAQSFNHVTKDFLEIKN